MINLHIRGVHVAIRIISVIKMFRRLKKYHITYVVKLWLKNKQLSLKNGFVGKRIWKKKFIDKWIK